MRHAPALVGVAGMGIDWAGNSFSDHWEAARASTRIIFVDELLEM